MGMLVQSLRRLQTKIYPFDDTWLSLFHLRFLLLNTQVLLSLVFVSYTLVRKFYLVFLLFQNGEFSSPHSGFVVVLLVFRFVFSIPNWFPHFWGNFIFPEGT